MLNVELINNIPDTTYLVDGLRDRPYTCFLDSSLVGPLGRWSFIAADPFAVMSMESGRLLINDQYNDCSPFAALGMMLDEYSLPSEQTDPPFTCGAMGFLSYDLSKHMENVPVRAVDDLPQPELTLAFYDCAIAFDHIEGNAWLSYLPSGKKKADDLLHMIRSIRRTDTIQHHVYIPGSDVDWSGVESNFTKPGYLAAVQQVKDYITAADVYQINLSQRFTIPYSDDPWSFYKVLRKVNPSPFGCFFDFPGLTLASVSPERLLHLDSMTRMVETRPIKGTRPRGGDPAEDRRLADELLASEKDRAENLMIVDLERNDLGRACEYGSVTVPSLWAIEEHPNVFQMVSTVRGKLAQGNGPAELLEACFPGGSITGAPKVRAMQIIEELEPNRRGVYTGSVGYIDFRGGMDFNIVIRSIVLRGGRAWFHAGGGIVIDSDPEKEYDETLDKVNGLVTALALHRENALT